MAGNQQYKKDFMHDICTHTFLQCYKPSFFISTLNHSHIKFYMKSFIDSLIILVSSPEFSTAEFLLASNLCKFFQSEKTKRKEFGSNTHLSNIAIPKFNTHCLLFWSFRCSFIKITTQHMATMKFINYYAKI